MISQQALSRCCLRILRAQHNCSSSSAMATPSCWPRAALCCEESFQEQQGYEVDTQGDALFAVFARASDGSRAAVAAQRALAAHSWPHGVAVRVRMGLHTGEPSRVTEGYVGLDVHRAARIMSAAHGGQVLLSQTTRDLVARDGDAEGVSLRDLGESSPQGFRGGNAPLSGGDCGTSRGFPSPQDAGRPSLTHFLCRQLRSLDERMRWRRSGSSCAARMCGW